MAQEQNYQVNYTINVDASQGTRQVIAFGEAVGKPGAGESLAVPCGKQHQDKMDELSQCLPSPKMGRSVV